MSLDIVSYLLGTKSAGGDSSQLELVQVTEEVTKGDILPVADIFSHSVIIALADHLYGGHSPIVAAFRSRTTTTLAFGESIAGSSGAYIEVTIDKTSKAITSIIAKVDGTSFATINTAIRFYLYNLK